MSRRGSSNLHLFNYPERFLQTFPSISATNTDLPTLTQIFSVISESSIPKQSPIHQPLQSLTAAPSKPPSSTVPSPRSWRDLRMGWSWSKIWSWAEKIHRLAGESGRQRKILWTHSRSNSMRSTTISTAPRARAGRRITAFQSIPNPNVGRMANTCRLAGFVAPEVYEKLGNMLQYRSEMMEVDLRSPSQGSNFSNESMS